jgi:hypothetical protein
MPWYGDLALSLALWVVLGFALAMAVARAFR